MNPSALTSNASMGCKQVNCSPCEPMLICIAKALLLGIHVITFKHSSFTKSPFVITARNLLFVCPVLAET